MLVSACLLGRCCRYNGEARVCLPILILRDLPEVQLLPVCPETAGGLPTPRPPAAVCHGDGFDILQRNARVLTAAGNDVTENYLRGAESAAAYAARYRPMLAILKARSPSCGVRSIHACHTKRLRTGPGVTAALLMRRFPAIPLLTEEDFPEVPIERLIHDPRRCLAEILHGVSTGSGRDRAGRYPCSKSTAR